MDISDFAADYLVDKKEVMRHLTASLLNEVMQLEAQRQIQAQTYERNGKRRAHRNGTRNRNLKTIHGEVKLKKPQFREFPFRTEVFARYSRVEASVGVAVVNGNLKFLNSGKVKFPTCKFLRSILRSYVDANREGVPHVERFVQRGFKHQRDSSADKL